MSRRLEWPSGCAAALVVAVLLLGARTAAAHPIGLSRGEYSVHGAMMEARLTFARRELEARFGAEQASAAAAVVARLGVFTDGRRCSSSIGAVREVAPDGLEIATRATCPSAGGVSFRWDFVDVLRPGHRHVAQVSNGARTTTFAAYRGNAAFTMEQDAAPPRDGPALAFLSMGIEHILTGWDHLAFLLGIAIAAFRLCAADGRSTMRTRVRALALAVTAFTVAHSVTLSLGVLGVLGVSPRWVEPLIALSVAYLGVEGFIGRAAAPYRATFAFGLVHGMGFAGALREVSIPRADVPAALALFNAGVEAGQLAALVPVVAFFTWLAARPLALPRVLRAASAALALGGALLFASRSFDSAREIAAARAPAPSSPVPRGTSNDEANPASSAVERLCSTLNELPRRRRAECNGEAAGASFAATCTRTLRKSVASGAIALSPPQIDACAVAASRRYESCAFTRDPAPAREPACATVLRGTRGADEPCTSSLECDAGLFCDGAGPLDAGICRKPKSAGAACGLAIDPLAGYVKLAVDDSHRECDGECVQNRCRSSDASRALVAKSGS